MTDPMARLGTSLADRYRIERELGQASASRSSTMRRSTVFDGVPGERESRGWAPAFRYGWNRQHLASTQLYANHSVAASDERAVGAGTRIRTETSLHSGTCEVPASATSAIPATRDDRMAVGTTRNDAPARVKIGPAGRREVTLWKQRGTKERETT